jgi:glycosyltransferase involved in cell wall biosynthesis
VVNFIYRNCDRILIQSTRFRDSITSHGFNDEKIDYFPNSVEEIFKPARGDYESAEAALLPKDFIVMFAGNIGAAQSFGTIVEAARKLKDHPMIHWVVLGDGRMRRWLESQVAEHSLQATFHPLGRFPLESMPRFFALADVMLVSLSRDPIFSMTIPSKIQSYLACGKPVIASLDGEGGRVIEESGAGISCPAEDADALADAVLAMHAMSRIEREAMGEKGRKYCTEHFDREMLLGRLERLLHELIKETKSEDTDPRWRRHAGPSTSNKSAVPP